YPNETQLNIAQYFNQKYLALNLERSTISKILKKKDKWLAIPDNEANTAVFRYKKVKSLLLDKAMQLWIEQVVDNQMFLMEAIIKEKAEFFAWALGLPDGVLKFSNG
ncbi:11826_t:CDS:1, partial [Ambispora leptoticha]